MTPNTKISTLFTQTDRKIVIDKLKNNPLLSVRFRSLKGELKERMIDFLCGTATLPLTYDPFFKKLFNHRKTASFREQLCLFLIS